MRFGVGALTLGLEVSSIIGAGGSNIVLESITDLWSVRKDDTHKSEPEHLCTCSAGIL